MPDAVRDACGLLGLDPMYVANEGKLVAFVAPEDADRVLAAMRAHPLGARAEAIGVCVDGASGHGGRPHRPRRHPGGGSARRRTAATDLLTGARSSTGPRCSPATPTRPIGSATAVRADARALHNGSAAEIRALARQFSGAWPYLRAMSRLTGIADPLDRRLVESYWLGGGIGADLRSPARSPPNCSRSSRRWPDTTGRI